MSTDRELVSMAPVYVLYVPFNRLPLGDYQISISRGCTNSRPVQMIDKTLYPWLEVFTLLVFADGL